MISEYSKQSIIQAADVVDVLQDFLQLRRVGSRYQCCCPFHGERTPSFYVNPRMNRWHCFGCGADGDAIEFLRKHQGLSFNEALEWLARKYGITIRYEKRERTPQEVDEAKHRESMWALLQDVTDWYISQLAEDTPEAANARQYAYGRWDKDFCSEKGIGYAPKGRAFLEWCEKRGHSPELLKELGLVADGDNGRYAMLRERITIPIRNRWGKVVGFTARYIGERKEVAKYMNSATSTVFKKDELLFGIDAAMRQARITNCFIIVEGAPDVLRLQSVGLSETVAPLGTALTEKQLDLLRPISKTIRFIPDSDPAKDGALYPAGIAAVMKNGALAMRCGFDVYVRELPRTKEDEADRVKKDPDSFISEAADYHNLDDRHFVVWYASKRFAGAHSSDLKREVVGEVAKLLILIEDKLLREMCIEDVCRIYGKAKMWREAMQEAGRKSGEMALAEMPDDKRADIEKLRRHNLVVRNNMYYTTGKDGELVRLSNFVMKSVRHIRDDEALRIFHLKNEFGQEEDIEILQSKLCSLQSFSKEVESLGNFVWLGKPDQFNRLKEYLYADTITSSTIKVLGWQPRGRFFAYADGIFANGRFIPADENGFVDYGGISYYLPAFAKQNIEREGNYAFERQFQYRTGSEMTLRQYAQNIADVFGDGGKVGFSWLLSCLFRDFIHSQTTYFPMLNLFGISQSGKTSLAIALASFFYNLVDPPKLGSTTKALMTRQLEKVCNSVMVFDEYTNLLKDWMIDILKAIWNGSTSSQMKLTETGLKEETRIVKSGVIICGQHQPTADDALFNRCLHLAYTRTSFSAEERVRFERLRQLNSRGNCHLAMEVFGHYEHFCKAFPAMYDTVRDEMVMRMGDERINSDRLLNNWSIPLTAYRIMEGLVDLPFSYSDMFDTFMRCFKYHNAACRKSSETAEFWKLIESLTNNGKIVQGTHFVIKHLQKFEPYGSKGESVNFDRSRALLYLNWAAVQGVLSQRSGLNMMKLDPDALEHYLRHSVHFLGIKQQRFIVLLPNGSPDVSYKDNVKVVKYMRPMALVFDYELLKAANEIDLESFSAPESSLQAEEVEVAPEQQEAPTPPNPTLFDKDDEDMPF